MRQDKSNPASSVDTPVNLGTNALTLVEIKLSSKQQMKRIKRKKKAVGGDDDGSQDEEPPEDLTGSPFPVLIIALLSTMTTSQFPSRWDHLCRGAS